MGVEVFLMVLGPGLGLGFGGLEVLLARRRLLASWMGFGRVFAALGPFFGWVPFF